MKSKKNRNIIILYIICYRYIHLNNFISDFKRNEKTKIYKCRTIFNDSTQIIY